MGPNNLIHAPRNSCCTTNAGTPQTQELTISRPSMDIRKSRLSRTLSVIFRSTSRCARDQFTTWQSNAGYPDLVFLLILLSKLSATMILMATCGFVSNSGKTKNGRCPVDFPAPKRPPTHQKHAPICQPAAEEKHEDAPQDTSSDRGTSWDK